MALAVALLGQGPRCTIDPALRTPGTALASYWEALQLNDVDGMRACSMPLPQRQPFPGMLWAFPSTRALTLEDLHYMPIGENEVMISYRVRYRGIGAEEERALHVMTDVVRWHGEWRVARPLAETGLLNGHPEPTRVDT